jgi:16S rRNA A1518/A1519 N6-dimethyltransferase RsmA/KsgA/DIM1 with predicted DNA glycosylase/AP lyase activity
MKGLLSSEDMTALRIDPTRRAETLTLAEFAALSNDISPLST